MSRPLKKRIKRFISKVLFNPVIQWVLVLLIAAITWFIFLTSKRKMENTKSLQRYKKEPAIFVFFHGRCAMLSPVIKSAGVPAYCIASQHTDGRMMARLQRLFGLRAVYGSSSKGALSVLRQGVDVIREKKVSMCITVDGPSGPSMRIKDGALYFARMTGAPIVPCCFSASRGFFMKRWDRFLVPGLFGTISVNIGQPIYIDSKMTGEELEKKRSEIEDVMEKQMRDLDADFNLFHVERDLTATEFKKQMRNQK